MRVNTDDRALHVMLKDRCSRCFFMDDWGNFQRDRNILKPGTSLHAKAWVVMHAGFESFSFDNEIQSFRFNFTEADEFIIESDIPVFYKDLSVGLNPPASEADLSANDIPVSLWDDGKPILSVQPNDWRHAELLEHIGDKADYAVVFTMSEGYRLVAHVLVSWARKPWNGFYLRGWRSRCAFVEVTDPLPLSDLPRGAKFDAVMDGEKLVRVGRSEPFAEVPADYAGAWSELLRTGFRSHIPVKMSYENHIELLLSIEKIREVTTFRRDSSMDVQPDWNLGKIILEKTDEPLPITLDPALLEFIEVPMENRKNPKVEMRLDGVLLEAVKFSDKGKRGRYDMMRGRVDHSPYWARLHYDAENDNRPYVNIIWDPSAQASFSLSCIDAEKQIDSTSYQVVPAWAAEI